MKKLLFSFVFCSSIIGLHGAEKQRIAEPYRSLCLTDPYDSDSFCCYLCLENQPPNIAQELTKCHQNCDRLCVRTIPKTEICIVYLWTRCLCLPVIISAFACNKAYQTCQHCTKTELNQYGTLPNSESMK